MAGGTINGTTGNQYIDSKIVWTATAITESNSSEVTAKLYYRRNNNGYETYGTGTFSITIGDKKTTESVYVSLNGEWVQVMSATVTIDHDNDGRKELYISASGSISGTSLTSTDCKDVVWLDVIPRASKIESITGKTLGSTCTVRWTCHSNKYSFKVKFTKGDWSHTSTALTFGGSAESYYAYKLPLDVANQITTSATGTMIVELYTFSDSSAKNPIGSDSNTFTVTVPNNDDTKPTMKWSVVPVTSVSKFSSFYIQGYSKISATVLEEEGKYGASITSKTMTVNGKTYSSTPFLSQTLNLSGTVKVNFTVKDSRGFSRTYLVSLNFLPYSLPKILPAANEKAIICERCDKDEKPTSSGTYLKIKAKRSYSKLTKDEEQNNFCIIRYRYRTESSTSFSSWSTILTKTASSDTVETKIANVVSSTTTAYVVQVGVVDDMGKTSAVQFVVPTDHVTLHMAEGGKRIGLMRYAENSPEEGIDVGAPIHGGAVDNLTLGTMLQATNSSPIDLNDVTKVGNYYSPNADISKYITNSPFTEGGFSLTVREIQNENMIRQELFYSRTNWQRHLDGSTGKWTDWLRYMMTEHPESIVADFVTETGVHQVDENSYWRYRKWKSGAVDLNGVFRLTPEMEGTTGTAVVRYSKHIEIPLPFKVESLQFTGTPASNYFLFTNAAVTTDDSGNNSVAFRLLRFSDFSDMSLYVRIIASGKYKTS